jgi:uncharacterized membrane protein (DUF4010 family)
MHEADLFLRLGSALAIGLLVGLQREYDQGERRQKLFAGVRTFPLFALAGATGALITDLVESPWPLVSVFIGLVVFIGIAYQANTRLGRMGLTSESSAILTMLAGTLCYYGYLELAAAMGVTITLLLSLKVEMHGLAQNMSREDLFAILKFAVITVIILPVLPNVNFGPEPLDVLNPYRIWLMVVFISGISFTGYLLIKALGPGRGIGLSGLLGGLVSSTAVTLSFSQRSRDQAGLANPLALAITISWTTMYIRVLVVVAVINAALVQLLWLPMVSSAAVGLAYCAYLYFRQRTDETGDLQFANPFELKPALQFGVLYAVILLVSRAAQVTLGDAGVYISSAVAGLADLNAITLSVAELSLAGLRVDLDVATRALVLAAIANMVAKGGIVLSMGSRGLRRALWPGLIMMSATGIVVVFLVT